MDMMVTTRRDETVVEEPPGYMKSTLTTPGPCARYDNDLYTTYLNIYLYLVMQPQERKSSRKV